MLHGIPMNEIKPGTKMRCRWINNSDTEVVARVIESYGLVYFVGREDEVCRISDYEMV